MDLETIWNFNKTGKGISTFLNIGNTCYLNCALQVLMHIPDLEQVFIQIESMNFQDRDIDFYQKLKSIYKGYWEDDCIIRTVGMAKYLNETTYFSYGEQWDSTEVLTYIIQKIHESVRTPIEINSDYQTNSQKEWNIYLEHKYSCLVDLFWGQYYTKTKCLECNHKSYKFETFHYLTIQAVLDVDNAESTIQLGQLFYNFIETKEFDSDNKYHCNQCKKEVDKANQKTMIWKLPQYLIIHLKRYYNPNNSKSIKKSNRVIQYPEVFNAFPIIHPKSPHYNESIEYQLHSGVFHYGTMNGGHYNCFTWNHTTNQWIHFDDEHRRIMTEPILENPNIYQLVYSIVRN